MNGTFQQTSTPDKILADLIAFIRRSGLTAGHFITILLVFWGEFGPSPIGYCYDLKRANPPMLVFINFHSIFFLLRLDGPRLFCINVIVPPVGNDRIFSSALLTKNYTFAFRTSRLVITPDVPSPFMHYG